jgi:hypothetical protein
VKRRAIALAVVAALALGLGTAAVLATGQAGTATGSEKWLHVSVVSHDAKGETVRVNVPLSLAEKVLPAINLDKRHKLQGGKIRINEFRVDGIDIRAVFEAVKESRDGEFVTVESKRETVRVAKEAGYLLVKVREERPARESMEGEKRPARTERVDVKIPMTVVEALLSAGQDELDLVAAIRALAAHGDAILVTVEDSRNSVKVWVDSKNTSAM